MPRPWGGQGLLGLIVKYDLIEDGENQGLHVLEVPSSSPANQAGLMSYKDFIIGSGDIIIRDSNDLSELLNTHVDKDLSLSIYNTDSEDIREVSVHPNRDWGGEGLLGCGIGSGALHRIPLARRPLRLPTDVPDSSSPPLGPSSPREPLPSPASPVDRFPDTPESSPVILIKGGLMPNEVPVVVSEPLTKEEPITSPSPDPDLMTQGPRLNLLALQPQVSTESSAPVTELNESTKRLPSESMSHVVETKIQLGPLPGVTNKRTMGSGTPTVTTTQPEMHVISTPVPLSDSVRAPETPVTLPPPLISSESALASDIPADEFMDENVAMAFGAMDSGEPEVTLPKSEGPDISKLFE